MTYLNDTGNTYLQYTIDKDTLLVFWDTYIHSKELDGLDGTWLVTKEITT